MDQRANEFCFGRFSPFEIVMKSFDVWCFHQSYLRPTAEKREVEKQIWKTFIFEHKFFRKWKSKIWNTFTFFQTKRFMSNVDSSLTVCLKVLCKLAQQTLSTLDISLAIKVGNCRHPADSIVAKKTVDDESSSVSTTPFSVVSDQLERILNRIK